MLRVGDKAPGFSLLNQAGINVSLHDYIGDWVLVWWIPSTMAEMTPACCDHIAENFGNAASRHPSLNVVGISFDSPKMMKDFAIRSNTLFPLLSDETREVGAAYGVRRTGEWDCFPKKASFLINPEGVVKKVYLDIDPDFHVDEVVADLEELAPQTVEGKQTLSTRLKTLVGIK